MKVFGDEMSHFSIQTNKELRRNGNVDTACALTKNYLDSAPCALPENNQLAITIVNSDIDFRSQRRKFKKPDYDLNYPCSTLFHHRFVLATHMAELAKLNDFKDSDSESFYVSTLSNIF